MGQPTQKDIFLRGEGDGYFSRHRDLVAPRSDDLVLRALAQYPITFTSFLEIGCSNGYRVAAIAESTGARGAGIDPGGEAIRAGRTEFGTSLDLRVGSADRLPFEDGAFDLVVFGFCLYLVDPEDHFRAIAEADRVLRDRGHMMVYDFVVSHPFSNEYNHFQGVRSRKMEFSRYFLAHPAYMLEYRCCQPCDPSLPASPNNTMGVDILKKDLSGAFPANPYQA